MIVPNDVVYRLLRFADVAVRVLVQRQLIGPEDASLLASSEDASLTSMHLDCCVSVAKGMGKEMDAPTAAAVRVLEAISDFLLNLNDYLSYGIISDDFVESLVFEAIAVGMIYQDLYMALTDEERLRQDAPSAMSIHRKGGLSRGANKRAEAETLWKKQALVEANRIRDLEPSIIQEELANKILPLLRHAPSEGTIVKTISAWENSGALPRSILNPRLPK